MRNSVFYLFAAVLIFGGQFLVSQDLVTGKPPAIEQRTLQNRDALAGVAQGPALIYFWAGWCGVCRGIQTQVDKVLRDYPGLTVAERSGDAAEVARYLNERGLDWPVVNDPDGELGLRYGLRGVPALFFLNRTGQIVFTTVGYTSEWGLRARLWLAGLI
ncbi:protein disulfide oxidoreductase [Methylomonas sp. MED-D]|uniref:protein disulfide oxidoreductase n=1 Tax=unclassified Methylomonas TaxID=2608980 RepID=UPI0008D91665|nr:MULTISPECIES: protein disulfide oxidoreductase [unclassified Methylomonas]NJA06713.1 protein disulfide oxidoreductase [Methylococcaceae bacterium WWC4]OHX37807.1 protein disulfide oxidoreductase [Methylomonas sp. LWB]WGS84716.1 protein disulfide oxidoreductase [Methylomonas sp. UP202]